MPTCQCEGGTCVCEAIQVPPKLPFWKKYDRPIHSFIAWMAVLNVALLAAAPIAMLAAEPPRPTLGASGAPVVSGVERCLQRCSEEAQKCSTSSASATAEQQHARCEVRTKECLSRCSLAPQLGLPEREDEDEHLKKPEKRETRSASSSEEAMRADLKTKKSLEIAKKRIGEFSRNLAAIKAKIAQLEKKGMQAPPGLKESLASGEALVESLKAAATPEDVQSLGDVQGSMESVATQLKSGLGAIEKQKNAPKKFLAIEKQLRGYDHQIATIKKLASDNETLAPKIADAEKALNDLKTAYRQAHDLIAAGSVDEGSALLESQVPNLMAVYKEAMKALYQARSEMPKS